MGLDKFFKSMENTLPKLENAMKLIGKKYNIETLNKLRTPSPYDPSNTLFFWREIFEMQMSIALDEEDIDDDFMLFINENDIYNPIFELENSELENVCFDIFHSWVGYGFQKSKLFNCGIPMGITVNSDIVSYYFNDFAYNGFSNFHQLYKTDERVTRPFERDLIIEEIFIRTHIIKAPYKKIRLVAVNSLTKEIVELENSILKNTKSNLNSDEIISSKEEKFELSSNYERNENTDLDALIKFFEATINKGFKFNLIESKLEK